ncbi:MAG TPA: hypothetical protein VND94_01020 [Terriglobia bacterium]|nr:hypothetical protein [Terriglobia bacterium]
MLTSHDSSVKQVSIATAATASQQSAYLRTFVSDPLAAQTIRNFNYGVTEYFGDANSEDALAANFWASCIAAYVWRPSAGSLVGWLSTPTASLFNTRPTGGEPQSTAGTYEMLSNTKPAAGSVTCQTGDVIIVEVWAQFTQDDAASHNGFFFYGGSTDPTFNHQTTSSAASYIEFPDTLLLNPDTLFAQSCM